ncbi:uncharacterized protein K452DRAFT_230005 [Aplosporella prunicola CBS 121167]|uniref:JmjC domain-containing protein n=1 Tax=Aplosporella prunicola CBS 121167 TaxID=1176127 RepID=A0A6A6B9P2_9PEZI|nr:uncharacterized protein K452DRAFT_230005 [Aplosporella prunicola CBS 121167]KAF2140790.1 hypothetical protein K452DRAFT_230005 [Aplosporella prunicola CBS 121167]
MLSPSLYEVVQPRPSHSHHTIRYIKSKELPQRGENNGNEKNNRLTNSVPTTDLITTYHELNATHIDTLTTEPSPLEFLRYVARNRPFVVRGGAADWPAVRKWDAAYLSSVMGSAAVNVAMTPAGNADALVRDPVGSGELLFVKPFETREPFADVLRRIAEQELHGTDPDVVRYAQTQNDNLRNEYLALAEDVPASVPFARIALAQPQGPDAVNFWLGNARSTTALHRDNYENVYVQVCGRKHFALLPALAAAAVAEREAIAATYVPEDGSEVKKLVPQRDDPPAKVLWPTLDPDSPSYSSANAFAECAPAMHVTLEPGDMLYLPALWYHKVSQSTSDEGICCAVNYWYDMDFSGPLWALATFARDVGRQVGGGGGGAAAGGTAGAETRA